MSPYLPVIYPRRMIPQEPTDGLYRLGPSLGELLYFLAIVAPWLFTLWVLT